MEWAKKTRRYGRRALVLPALLLMASLLAGCAGSDDTPVGGQEQEAMIRVSADVWRVMEDTRATTFDNIAALQDGIFECYAYYDGTTNLYINGSTVSWNSTQNEWLFDDGTHRWPSTGALNFFAFMPSDLDNTHCTFDPTPYDAESNTDGYSDDSPRIKCTGLPVAITSNSDNTQELIYAYTPNQTKAAQGATGVTMTFKHPFARVYFKIADASGTAVSINSVTVEDIYNSGTCTFDGTTTIWTPSGTQENNLVITCDPALTTGVTNIVGPFLMLPQDFASNRTFTVNATWTDWSDVTKDVNASVNIGSWEQGHSYTYTLTLSKYALEVDKQKFTEQW